MSKVPLPALSLLQEGLSQITLPLLDANAMQTYRRGRLVVIGPTLLKAWLPWASQGEVCEILPSGLRAEVVSLENGYAWLSPFDVSLGLQCGQWVVSSGSQHKVGLSPNLLGAVVDGLGRVISGNVGLYEEWRSLHAEAPPPLSRAIIDTPMPLGVTAIDGLLTCGVGQRVGIFAAAGGGKSTLLSMICSGTQADVIVLALVGERGREVREFLEMVLTPEARKRCVIVVSTSEKPALERLKACYTATTIAEYFRDKGLNVLLMVDSLTRYARAAREVGLAAGEPPVTGGFPPSVFANLPRLLERAGPAARGSITAIYTVLVEGDNMNEPVADEVRSILDGHIILSRKLAEENHYPAIDIPASISRVMQQVVSKKHRQQAGKVRRMMGVFKDIELLVRIGEFKLGHDAEADEAVRRWPYIRQFLCQNTDDLVPWQTILTQLEDIAEG